MSKFFSVVLLIGLFVLIVFSVRRLVQTIKKFVASRKKDTTQPPATFDCSESPEDSDQNTNKEV